MLNEDYTENDNGNKRLAMSVISDLHKKGIDKDSLKAKIKDIAIKTVIAIQPFLINTFHVEMGVGNVNTNVFHIFGIDILVD